MAGSSVRNRSAPATVQTPRGAIEIVCQEWRSQHAGSRWELEWLARRQGTHGWRQASTAREAIRQATLLSPGKPPRWLIEAAAQATEELAPGRPSAGGG